MTIFSEFSSSPLSWLFQSVYYLVSLFMCMFIRLCPTPQCSSKCVCGIFQTVRFNRLMKVLLHTSVLQQVQCFNKCCSSMSEIQHHTSDENTQWIPWSVFCYMFSSWMSSSIYLILPHRVKNTIQNMKNFFRLC